MAKEKQKTEINSKDPNEITYIAMKTAEKEELYGPFDTVAALMESLNSPDGYIYYKNYTGTVEFSEEDNVFYGQIIGIDALVSYEGKDMQELTKDFRNAVDDYIAYRTEKNKNKDI